VYPYRTPGVYFEWLDPPASLGLRRTDIAGFVGVAARGPLFEPVKVESMTQFTSTFGGLIPQGYLAYAVRGFFANGGVTCYVVRVADRAQAQPARLIFVDTTEERTLQLTARSPGVWGRRVRVELTNLGADRFSLNLQIPGDGQERWRDLSMALAHLTLVDESGLPVLRLSAFNPEIWQREVQLETGSDWDGRLALTFTWPNSNREPEVWRNLSLEQGNPRYVETVLGQSGKYSRWLSATDLRPAGQRLGQKPDGSPIRLSAATVGGDQVARFTPEPRYVETVLNDPTTGSRLVTATNLFSPAGFPDNAPVRALSVAVPSETQYPLQAGKQVELLDEYRQPFLRLTADASLKDLTGVHVERGSRGRFALTLRGHNAPSLHRWEDLTLEPGEPRTVENVLNQTKDILRAERTSRLFAFPTRGRYVLQGGRDGLKTMSQQHIRQGLDELKNVDEVSMLAIPDLMFQQPLPPRFLDPPQRCDVPEDDTDFPLPEDEMEYPPSLSATEISLLQWAMIGQCEELKDRIAILDMPRNADNVPAARAWRNNFDSKYAALYFPWLRVPDVLRLGDELLRSVPPSGHIAGVYARGDRTIGVHKPPANEALEGVQAATIEIDDIAHGMLNERGVNAIRPYPGRGVRVAGARTLSSDALWRYVNVRRLLMMIEESVEEQLQWVVFENNNTDLWRELSRLVRSFLDGLWRQGMLDGITAEQAYTVTCDETTNPPAETDQGRLICQIGVLPPWPAEFVIVRIGKTEYGTQITESREVGNG
jgi:hypothetical protein